MNVFFPLKALIYTDDFKSERADRENAQGQIEDLKEQISQLKQELRTQVRRQPCGWLLFGLEGVAGVREPDVVFVNPCREQAETCVVCT